MSTNPTLDLDAIRKKLKRLGFQKIRQKKHEIWDDGCGHIVPLSRGNEDVGKTLLKLIASEAGLTVDQFLEI